MKLITDSSTGRTVELDAVRGDRAGQTVRCALRAGPLNCRVAGCGTRRTHVLPCAEQVLPPRKDEKDELDATRDE